MKSKMLVFFMFAGFTLNACNDQEQEKIEIKTEKDKVSYSIGLDIGKNFKKQSIDVDLSVLLQGMTDGMTNSNYLMTQAEIQETMMSLQYNMRKKNDPKFKETSDKNEKEGKDFLERNKNKPGVVTTASGLQYKILKPGDGDSPKSTDQVKVNYTGKFIDGNVFDSSEKVGKPVVFPANQVIAGWTEALQLMKVGGKWELYIPSDLAYGKFGSQNIGPNATLIFAVELVSIEK